MPKKRGKDRRQNDIIIDINRRKSEDRRENSFISKQALWDDMTYDEVEQLLVYCQKINLRKGEVLLSKGEKNSLLFLLIKGKLKVYFEEEADHASIEVNIGECIGELSIIDDDTSSAYVRAAEDCQLVVVSEESFWKEFVHYPNVAKNMLRILALRLRNKNEILHQALEQSYRLKQLEHDLEIAHRIQQDMLPPSKPLNENSVDLHCYMKPARQVGGDFYDAYMINENEVFIAVGDVSGKGMPASLYMSRCLTLLRREIGREIRRDIKQGYGETNELRDAISKINQEMCTNNSNGLFVSLIVGVFSLSSGILSYISCGHNPPYIRRKSHDYKLCEKSDNFFIGIIKDAEFTIQHEQLSPDNELIFYTDGITEAMNQNNQFYGHERLNQLLSRQSNNSSAEQLTTNILDDVRQFVNGHEAADDMTLLVLKY